MRVILLSILLFPLLSLRADDVFVGEDYFLGTDIEFSLVESRCRKFFAANSQDVLKSIFRIFTELSHSHCNIPEDLALFGSDDRWLSFKEKLLDIYPDYHQKLLKQEERMLVLNSLEHHSYEKILDKYPDLYENIKKFPDRYRELSENPTLREMRLSQNEDGSWGNKEKVHCTSIGLMVCLFYGEITTSKVYGKMVVKALKFLLNSKPKKRDLNFYMWTLAESYSFMGIEAIEKKLYESLEAFQKGILKINEVERDPHRLFLQTVALKSLYSAGLDIDDFVLDYNDQLKRFNKGLVVDSAPLWAVFQSFGLECTISVELPEKVIAQFSSTEPSMLGEYIRYFVSFNQAGKLWKKVRKLLYERLSSAGDETIHYRIDERFDAGEEAWLRKVIPGFLEGSGFSRRRFPSVWNTLNLPPKRTKPRSLDEEGLELID